MDITKFKYVVNEAKTDEVCDIRFFDSVNEYTANTFNSVFITIEQPKLIRNIRV